MKLSLSITSIKVFLRQSKWLRFLIGCPYPAPRWNRAVKRIIQLFVTEAKVLDLGAGAGRLSTNIINLDIVETADTDVIGDGHYLPLQDQVFDVVVNCAVLEHVKEPKSVVAEIERVLKPGGYVCAAVPFLQGFHASPYDYQRYTIAGFDHLFVDFNKIEGDACSGPTTAFHWFFREYVGLILSFGSLTLAKSISLLIGWLTFPVVWLDYLLLLHPHAHILSSAIYFIGQKPRI